MLIPQKAQCGADARQGGLGAGLSELRRQLADPSAIDGEHRQRLLELARRLARVRALGDEYARVDWSPKARRALECGLYVAQA